MKKQSQRFEELCSGLKGALGVSFILAVISGGIYELVNLVAFHGSSEYGSIRLAAIVFLFMFCLLLACVLLYMSAPKFWDAVKAARSDRGVDNVEFVLLRLLPDISSIAKFLEW